MKSILKVSEIFESVQGEGRYQGEVATFVRLSGCTRSCDFCDTKYHSIFKEIVFDELFKVIGENLFSIIIFTGGEPLVQWGNLRKFLKLNSFNKYMFKQEFQLETNGDLINSSVFLGHLLNYFNYIAISPKDKKTAEKIFNIYRRFRNNNFWFNKRHMDIKIVTDLETVGVDMLPFATMLMPLTTHDKKKDLEIRRKVWNFCTDKHLFYSGRLHVEVWGKKRKV